MTKFYNSDIADLAHQLTLSPRRLRVEQLRGVEQLLAMTDPNRAYPFEFVCYHITKYRKRGASTAASIPGKALISDLVLMAEIISRKANMTTAELGEPYKSHIELADDLKVSTKTIRRWRHRGLMGLRVVYVDGVNRLAFCQRTIDRFVKDHRSLVSKGAAFKQLSLQEREYIIQRAHELVAKQPLKLHATARIIAEETGRAIETIRYTLRRHDRQKDTTPIFTKRGEVICCERELAIKRCHDAGDSIRSIARAFDCPIIEIDQILRGIDLKTWCQNPPEYMSNELFDAMNADDLILRVAEPQAEKKTSARIPKGLPAYLQSLYMTPLLSREQEQDLFRRYNYLKYKAAKVLKKIDPVEATKKQYVVASDLNQKIDLFRQRIIQANLRLVVSIAKKHVGNTKNIFEIISDGNVSLMRAVEKFDYAMGNRFSTYATWAIVKNYARTIPEQHYHYAKYVTGQEAILDSAPDTTPETSLPSDRNRVRELIETGMQELSDREQEIVRNHFGLVDQGHTMTLEQLGKRFGVTKERIRQIEKRALGQLREVLSPTLAEAL